MGQIDPAFGFYRHNIDDHDGYAEDIKALVLGDSRAGVELASTALTTSVTGLNSTTAADITGVTCTFTLAAATVVLVKLTIPSITLTVTDAGVFEAFIVTGTSLLDRGFVNLLTGTAGSVTAEARQSLTAGTYTYKAQYLVAGTGATAVVDAANSAPNFYGPRISVVGAS